jgi:purine-nucleoside phosphorylase
VSEERVGIVLGSGLGEFANTLEDRFETFYSEIAGWPASTAIGHAGKLVTGRIGSTEVIFGIRELGRRGVRSLVLTNAAGGINLDFHSGELVMISDHINLTGCNPLAGHNDESLGPRFPDMSEVYSREYREIAKKEGQDLGLTLREGVYAAMLGPSYETPAEIRFLRTIGADLIGMSTALEAIAAAHLGMKVLGISCVTNMAAGILPSRLVHEEVVETSARMSAILNKLLTAVVPKLS